MMQIETGLVGVDSTVLIDFLAGDKEAITFIDSYREQLVVSDLVAFEVLSGNIPPNKQRQVYEMISSMERLPFDAQSAPLAAMIYRLGKIEGNSLGSSDAAIAGSYLAKGISQIVTRDVKHFERIEGLTVLTY